MTETATPGPPHEQSGPEQFPTEQSAPEQSAPEQQQQPMMSAAQPPQGPGAVPPFPAPPTEGRSGRLWLGLGLGGLALLLCCGGGGAAVFGIGTVAAQAFNEQVDVVVGDYFEAVKGGRFEDAYAQQCEDVKKDETAAEFARRVGAQPDITSYDVGDISLSSASPAVPVRVVYSDGSDDTLEVDLQQDQGTGQFEVCGVGG